MQQIIFFKSSLSLVLKDENVIENAESAQIINEF